MARTTTPPAPGRKRCSRCKREKPLDHFGPNKATADGRAAYCKPCRRAHSQGLPPTPPPGAQASIPQGAVTEAPTPGQVLGELRARELAAAEQDLTGAWPPPRRRGAPSKLTHELIDQVHRALCLGNTRSSAAALAGVHEATLRAWFNEGEDAKEGLKRELYEAVLEGEAQRDAFCVKLIRREMITDVRQAWRMLERRNPQEWGRREVLGLEVGEKPPDASLARELIGKRIAALIASRPGPGGAPGPSGAGNGGAAADVGPAPPPPQAPPA